MINTLARVQELAAERDLNFHALAEKCRVPYSTLKSAKKRNSQLRMDTIEQICEGLEITLYDFFVGAVSEKDETP